MVVEVVVRLSILFPIIWKKNWGTMLKWCFVCTCTKYVETTRNHYSCQYKGPTVLWALTNHNSLPSNDLMDLHTKLLMIAQGYRLVVYTCGSWYINHTFDIEALQVAFYFLTNQGILIYVIGGCLTTTNARHLSQKPSLCKIPHPPPLNSS